ncbi:hypothetical protein KEM48_003253 [Puccinia striiformis f. sp. tritici PST-130]|nr:hypothetical protein KEM48_003253 [Puccinia striiformis f. sp. tritici PST-130]
MDVVYHRHSPDAAGLILSVKESLKSKTLLNRNIDLGKLSSRKLIEDDRGFRLIRNVLIVIDSLLFSAFTCFRPQTTTVFFFSSFEQKKKHKKFGRTYS